MEAEAGIEPTYADLQSAAWPLCHSARQPNRNQAFGIDLSPWATWTPGRRHGYIEGHAQGVKAMVLRPEGTARGVVDCPPNAYKQAL